MIKMLTIKRLNTVFSKDPITVYSCRLQLIFHTLQHGL